VIEDFGEDGSKMLEGDDTAAMLSPPDLAMLSDPKFAESFGHNDAFAQGVLAMWTIESPTDRLLAGQVLMSTEWPVLSS